jgi:hypothetical protein
MCLLNKFLGEQLTRMAEEKQLLRSLTVLPLPQPVLDTLPTRAVLIVPGHQDVIEVPAAGVKVVFEEPIDVGRRFINARVWSFDRQTEDCFFTVDGPLPKPDADGHIYLTIACYGPSAVFGMYQSDADGEHLNGK